jgi:hypothetical protein
MSGVRARSARTSAPAGGAHSRTALTRFIWRIADKWYLDGHAQFFALKFDQYEGRLIDAQASIIWQTFRHLGLGLGYNYFGTRVDVDGHLLHGRLEWDYSGLMLFARASF